MNSDICSVSGVSLKALNDMEEEFLYVLDFQLIVDEPEYTKYLEGLQFFFSQPLESDTIQVIEEIRMAMQAME